MREQPPITLYSYAMSPYAAKVHCFLLYKRLDFRCFYINPLRAKRELPVGHQVPVVTIGDESRADSTPIGLWLDEVFPDEPRLLPAEGAEREQLLKLDGWISQRLIPATFRLFPGPGIDRFRNGWKLGSVMARTAEGGLPWALRIAWPLVISRVAFARRLVAQADDGLPVAESKRRLYETFAGHLQGGPFLCGRREPSLPDLAAYPQFALFWAHGFHGGRDVEQHPEIMAWLTRMRPFVSGDPPLVPAGVGKRSLP